MFLMPREDRNYLASNMDPALFWKQYTEYHYHKNWIEGTVRKTLEEQEACSLPPPPPLIKDRNTSQIRSSTNITSHALFVKVKEKENLPPVTVPSPRDYALSTRCDVNFPTSTVEADSIVSLKSDSKSVATGSLSYGDEKSDLNTPLKCRGRPSASFIKVLQEKSNNAPQRYMCSECSRSFPRKKSLDTHFLTHGSVKPYICDYPGCSRSFKQSGQLKTHIRLHTGEKPFRCMFPGCSTAFAHANRKCNLHPNTPLKRLAGQSLSPKIYADLLFENEENMDDCKSKAVRAWLRKQILSRDVPKCKENDSNTTPSSATTRMKDFIGGWSESKGSLATRNSVDNTNASEEKADHMFDSLMSQSPLAFGNSREASISSDLCSPLSSKQRVESMHSICPPLMNMKDATNNVLRDSVIMKHSNGHLKRENDDYLKERTRYGHRREAIIKHSTDYEYLSKCVDMTHVRKKIKIDDSLPTKEQIYFEEGRKRMMSAMALIELQRNSPI